MKKMFIVESPNKIQKLRKILGDDYVIVASVGHIRSIPKRGLNISVDSDFLPRFEISSGKKDVVSNIKKVASQCAEVIIATDLDREGEAIAYHIYDILPAKDQKKCCRVTFTEITQKAVLDSLKNKREINYKLVDAQKARQVLDRLIGYSISPLLWQKVASKTSAGRVQSIALKIVSDREKEINDFKPQDFWYVDAELKSGSGYFTARVVTKDKDNRYSDEKLVDSDILDLSSASYKVDKVLEKKKSIKPYPPFDTSSMQTTASSLLNWPVKKTSQVAQKLYEQGLTSYIRSDSFSIAPEALSSVREFIKGDIGNDYLPGSANYYAKKAKSSSQEAHECIRPTDCSYTGDDLVSDEKILYNLIRDRFISCQMKPMVVNTVAYDIKASSGHNLISRGKSLNFDGWSRVWSYGSSKDKILPVVKKGDSLNLNKLDKTKGTTKPPPRYNEGSLVKKMEEEGVGRPSTYPTIIENINNRNYVKKLDKKGTMAATELGTQVSEYLSEKFSDFIMDIRYTASLEDDLDVIEDGKKSYLDVVKSTYDQMIAKIREAKGMTIEITGSNKCTVCGEGIISERTGRYGSFFSCDRYPDCKSIFEINDKGEFYQKQKKEIDKSKKCPECEKKKREGYLLKRKNRKKDSYFYGCSNYPKCKHTESDSLEGFGI